MYIYIYIYIYTAKNSVYKRQVKRQRHDDMKCRKPRSILHKGKS